MRNGRSEGFSLDLTIPSGNVQDEPFQVLGFRMSCKRRVVRGLPQTTDDAHGSVGGQGGRHDGVLKQGGVHDL